MEQAQVYVDRNRNTYLEYRDTGKVKHFVCMLDGSIDTVQLPPKDYKSFIPRDITPQHFAQKYLSSLLPISRSARAILRGFLGDSDEKTEAADSTRFTSGTVSLQEICEGNNWEPSRVRKHLRKLIEKPGGRWAWSPEEAERIVTIIRECMLNENDPS